MNATNTPSNTPRQSSSVSAEALHDLAKYLRMEPTVEGPARYSSFVAKVKWCADKLDDYARELAATHPIAPSANVDANVHVGEAVACDTCGGDGWVEGSEAGCCGNYRNEECCGNPIPVRTQDQCPECGGSGVVPAAPQPSPTPVSPIPQAGAVTDAVRALVAKWRNEAKRLRRPVSLLVAMSDNAPAPGERESLASDAESYADELEAAFAATLTPQSQDAQDAALGRMLREKAPRDDGLPNPPDAIERDAQEGTGDVDVVRDAERYRWLRDAHIYNAPAGSLIELWLFSRPTATAIAFDTAIDAAIAQGAK